MNPWHVLAMHEVFKRGLKNADLLNKSESLKTVICPWKIFEKSLFVWSCTNHVWGVGMEKGFPNKHQAG